MKLVNKNVTVFKVIVGIISFAIGLLTLIFSILNLAGNGPVASGIALRITLGIMLCILGLANAVILFIDKNNVNLPSIAGMAIVIGFGIFLFTKSSDVVIETLIGFVFPIITAAFGGVLLIKCIIELARKSFGSNIFLLLLGIALLVAGILFAVFHEKTIQVIWLFVGLAIMAGSVFFIIKAAKNKSSVKVQVTE